MLEGVSIDIAFAQRFVRQNVIVKRDQLNVQTVFFFCYFLRDFCNLLLCANNNAHFDVIRIFFILTATHKCQRTDQGSNCRKGFEFERHAYFLFLMSF